MTFQSPAIDRTAGFDGSPLSSFILTLRPFTAPPKLPAGPLTMKGLVMAVAYVCNTTVADILNQGRFTEHVRARHLFMWACREWLLAPNRIDAPKSYPQIGAFLNRDHTTIIYGVGKVNKNMELFQGDIDLIEAMIFPSQP